jgi:hypothetical protein
MSNGSRDWMFRHVTFVLAAPLLDTLRASFFALHKGRQKRIARNFPRKREVSLRDAIFLSACI